MAPRFDPKDLRAIFEHRVLRMLLSRGKITRDFMALIRSWRHSGFQVYVGPRIQPGEEEATENLARYIIRASFSQERMTYLPEESKVIYESKDGKEEKVFDALDWLAAMTSHVPNKGEQMVRYYGHYSNASRGLRQKKNLDDLIPSILEPEDLKPNRTWARLIQKIYEVDPLTCPKCQGQMRILAFIEDEEVIEKILKHLGLWDLKARPPPNVKAPSVTISIDDSDSQVPFSAPPFYPDPDYPMDSYRISKPRGAAPMVTVSAIDVLFSDYRKCLDLIFIYLPGMMISTGNLRLLKLASIADK